MSVNLIIYTEGDRNIRLIAKDDLEATIIIEKIQKNGGLWHEESFFPYHSMTQFDMEDNLDEEKFF